jgi:hypothetical protein
MHGGSHLLHERVASDEVVMRLDKLTVIEE